jgi:AmmeMemoRadiSam system protein A
MLEPRRADLVLRLARRAIAEALGLDGAPAVDLSAAPWLGETGATFVTLTLDDRLRGCVGSVRAWRALAEDVCANAVGAALRDPRFPPLAAAELQATRIEVSLLSPLEQLDAADERSATALLRAGVDGVVLEAGVRRAVFLPQVWSDLPDPLDFLHQLRRKAGLEPAAWPREARLLRFSVVKLREE